MRNPLVMLLLVLISILSATQEEIPFHPADQSLLAMPTAYTMPKGMQAITDYEVLLLQYSAAITNTTHISFMTPFPITSELLEYFSIGIKQNFLKTRNLESAFWATASPKLKGYSIGNVISFKKDNHSLHLAAMRSFGTKKSDLENMTILMAGTNLGMSLRSSFIIEYLLYKDKKDTEAVIVLGIRLKGEKISWDLGGFRPTDSEFSDLILLPFLKATFMF
jgi:hypothetical protein